MTRKRKQKKQRGAAWEPRVIYRADRSKWMVDCGFKFGSDKRLRKMFETEMDATTWAAEKKSEFLKVLVGQKRDAKVGAFTRLSSLTDTQRNHIVSAMAKIENDTAQIVRAVDFYLKHTNKAESSRLLCRVYRDYITGKRKLGRRQRTVKDAHQKLKPFVVKFRTERISAITTNDIEGWLNERGYSAGTRNAYTAALMGLFNYGFKRKYIEYNPVAVIEHSIMDQGLPKIHSVDEVRKMLFAARDYVPPKTYIVTQRDKSRKVIKGEQRLETKPAKIHAARSKIVPYLAVGYFAGLRPNNELVNLDWKDIDFEARTIRVDPATSKKRRQRYVDMSGNLATWLAPYIQKSGKIGFSRRIFRAIRDAAKVQWTHDVMRHCFGSYHLAAHENAAQTSLQMGHSRISELFKSYRNLVKKTAAENYWQLIPHPKSNIIQMPIARTG